MDLGVQLLEINLKDLSDGKIELSDHFLKGQNPNFILS